MAEPRPFIVFAFESTHAALEAEEALRRAAIDVVPIPTPASLGTLCGLAMRVPPEQADRARTLLLSAGVAPQAEAAIEDV